MLSAFTMYVGCNVPCPVSPDLMFPTILWPVNLHFNRRQSQSRFQLPSFKDVVNDLLPTTADMSDACCPTESAWPGHLSQEEDQDAQDAQDAHDEVRDRPRKRARYITRAWYVNPVHPALRLLRPLRP